jgi:hypothetical protein
MRLRPSTLRMVQLVALCMAATPVALARAQVTLATSFAEREKLERDFIDPLTTVQHH